MATSKKVTIGFSYEKDTTNKVRFKELAENPRIGILYLTKKSYEAMGKPKNINVTLETA